jgi:hypothetical protein
MLTLLENKLRNNQMSQTKKSVVFSCVTYPQDLRYFFNDLATAGYDDIRHFEISNQAELLQAMSEESDAGNPVALICSNRMSAYGGGFNGAYAGAYNGDELADAVEESTTGDVLTIIYSSESVDNMSALESDARHKLTALAKPIFPAETRGEDSEVAANALNKFFGSNAPKPKR